MSTNKRPFVLSIAGMDPTAGAGILADIKTLENHGCYGLAVNTANTIQDDREFKACHWLSEALVFQQVNILLNRFPIEVVKIGVIENLEILNKILKRLVSVNPEIKIIWDPVLSSSSGFSFQDLSKFRNNLEEVLEKIFLITPNFIEIKKLYSGESLENSIQLIQAKTNLLLKGGHRQEAIGQDEIFTLEGKHFTIPAGREACFEKHGSGCVLSSAIAGNLAKGFLLVEACKRAKCYTENFLASNQSLIGYHIL